MNRQYAPGCALMAYKLHLAEKLKTLAENQYGQMDTILTCCFSNPSQAKDSCIITPCVTCATRYAKQHPESTIVFLLDLIAEQADFPFPDYGGISMSIQDTCASRSMLPAQQTIRKLLDKMNIRLVEPEKTGPRTKCCGQTFYGKLEVEKVKSLMTARASEMPCEEVVVYCPSCIMSMAQGGKKPRYILDLLFGESTELKDQDIILWNQRLSDFRKRHAPVSEE